MTGEITLTGQVLQIGGVREKVLAAQRAGVKTVVLPKDNEPDLAELPDEAREQLSFVLADSIGEVLEVVFDSSLPGRAARAAPLPGRKAAHAE
jgi:ATP-dependent Lon protease